MSAAEKQIFFGSLPKQFFYVLLFWGSLCGSLLRHFSVTSIDLAEPRLCLDESSTRFRARLPMQHAQAWCAPTETQSRVDGPNPHWEGRGFPVILEVHNGRVLAPHASGRRWTLYCAVATSVPKPDCSPVIPPEDPPRRISPHDPPTGSPQGIPPVGSPQRIPWRNP